MTDGGEKGSGAITVRAGLRAREKSAAEELHALILCPDRHARARLSQALRSRATITVCKSEAEAKSRLAELPFAVVVACITNEQATAVTSAMHQLHIAFPSVPIIAYCDIRRLDRHAFLNAVQAGVSDLILEEIDDGDAVAEHVLAHAIHLAHADAWLEELRDDIPGVLRGFLRYGLRVPNAADDLAATALAFGLARRTLSKRLAAASAPTPRRFFTWTRLILAASLLSDPGRSLQSVALQLHLGSGNALRQLMLRYANVGIGAGRDRSHICPAIKRTFLVELAWARRA